MTVGSAAPTRAGRLRLMARLQVARHGANLLHSKEEVLQRERIRLEGHVVRTRQQWAHDCADAATWLRRSRALGASTELTAIIANGPEPASVTPNWQTAMGVTYPGSVATTAGPSPVVRTTAALRPTMEAYRRALQTAADHASTTTALRRLDTELANTRRRRRAIERRLVPRLERSIHRLDLHLDEQDRDEALRVHIALSQQEAGRP